MNLSHKSVELLKKHGFNNNLQLFDEVPGNTSGEINEFDKNTNFILEAKKVILEEQYDKLSNMQLREIVAEELNDTCNEILIPIKKQYKNDTKAEAIPLNNTVKTAVGINDTGQLQIVSKSKFNCNFSREHFLIKYFQKWKEYTFNECHKLENNILVDKKLNTLLETINVKKQKQKCTKETSYHSLSIEIQQRAKSTDNTIFINRYNAQKNIIQQQKEKLKEQQRLIEELKFNKIKLDIEKSVEQSKYEIQNIFKNCSNKVKCKIGKIIDKSSDASNSMEDSTDQNMIFDLKSFKVPKMVKEMEKRAMERDLNRQIIRERKRIIDENRKKLGEELLQKKRFLDEDETKRNLEMMKEKRRQDIEKEKIRQKNRGAYIESCKIADNFYESKILRIYFDYWIRLITMKEFNETKAECYYERKLQMKCFNSLLANSRAVIAVKNRQADNLYNFKLKKYHMLKLKFLLRQKRRDLQVATDFYDMRLEQRIFVQWHRNVCQLQMVQMKLTKRADMHYLKKIKFYYFYQWRTLSVVLLLEKAKEEKRMKWRRKVLEVLPDYKPPIDD